MEMSSQNVRANLGPFESAYQGCCLAVARPGLEEIRHEGQYLGSRAQ